MKNKLSVKVVYRNYGGVYARKSSDGKFVNIEHDLPGVLYCVDHHLLSRASLVFYGCKALLWKDKHGNFILRYIPNVQQSKINF